MNGRKAEELRRLAKAIVLGKAPNPDAVPERSYDWIKPKESAPKNEKGTRFMPPHGSVRGMYRHLKKLYKRGIIR